MMGGEHVAGKDIAIDLGTSTIKIHMEGKGIVLNEPAVVAVDLINDEIIAIGNEAYAMLGRTSERVSVVQPLCHGVISDYDLIQYTIQTFLKKITDSISSLVTSAYWGKPVIKLRPLILCLTSSVLGYTQPMAILTSSAVRFPINR